MSLDGKWIRRNETREFEEGPFNEERINRAEEHLNAKKYRAKNDLMFFKEDLIELARKNGNKVSMDQIKEMTSGTYFDVGDMLYLIGSLKNAEIEIDTSKALDENRGKIR